MERQQLVGAVILAAGESRRFGGPKQVAELDGHSLLEHVLTLAAEADLAPIVAVVPPWLTPPVGWDDGRVRWVHNPHPERGMSHSLRLGFDAIPADIDAAVILLGDQPLVPLDHVRAVVGARGSLPIIAICAEGRTAPPVLVERSHFPVVQGVGGDIGLREVIEAHPEWVTTVEVPTHSPDIDTQADLDRLLHG